MRRDNLIGYLLLLFCCVSAAIMIRAIVTGDGVSVVIPGWMRLLLIAVFGGGLLWWLLYGRSGRWKL